MSDKTSVQFMGLTFLHQGESEVWVFVWTIIQTFMWLNSIELNLTSSQKS